MSQWVGLWLIHSFRLEIAIRPLRAFFWWIWCRQGMQRLPTAFSPAPSTGSAWRPFPGRSTEPNLLPNNHISPNSREFSCGDGLAAHRDLGYFYGSSYVASPDGSRTPVREFHPHYWTSPEIDTNWWSKNTFYDNSQGLGRLRDGVLLTKVNHNHRSLAIDIWSAS